jgi:hypothetical protein
LAVVVELLVNSKLPVLRLEPQEEIERGLVVEVKLSSGVGD